MEPKPLPHELVFLLDTNILIAAENHASVGHLFGKEATEFLRLASQIRARVILSAGTTDDLQRTTNEATQRLRKELAKYAVAEKAHIPDRVRALFPANPSSQDAADMQVLATAASGLSDVLVTKDNRLLARGTRLGGVNALDLESAVAYLRTLVGDRFTSPPAVDQVQAQQINQDAAVFESLKADYADFSTWWRDKVVHERRDVFIIGEPSDPEALTVLKAENSIPGNSAYDGKPVLKVCTFKADAGRRGLRFGELLLKTVVQYARKKKLDSIYLTVNPSNEPLIVWLPKFGFQQLPHNYDGDLVFRKALRPESNAAIITSLDYAIAYGPGALLIRRAFAVPIQKGFSHRLLAEARGQGLLLEGEEASGNAILKAYICKAAIRSLSPGDALVFIETGNGNARAIAIGVVEQCLVTSNSVELLKFVGTRTVFSKQELDDFCKQGENLAILFRFDRSINPPWSISSLISRQVVNGRTPMSISEIKGEGLKWLQATITE